MIKPMLQSFLVKPTAEKIRAIFLSITCFYIAFMPIFPTFFKGFGYTPNVEIRNYLIIGSLSLLILWFVANFKYQLKLFRSPIIFGWLIFLSFSALSILWTINQYEAYLVIIQWLGGFVFFLYLGLILREERDISLIVYSILIAGLITAIIGQIQSHSEIIDHLIVQAVKPSSTFANKNMAAHIQSLSFAVGVCLFLRATSLVKNISFATIVAIMMSYIFFSKTRAAWLALIVMSLVLIGFLVWMSYKKSDSIKLNLLSKNKLIGYITFTITMFVLHTIGDTPLDIETASKMIDFKSDSNDRIPMFLNTFNMFTDYPLFGVGLGNWTVHYPYYMSSQFNDFVFSLSAEHYHTHNDILQVLTETGIIGFLMIATTVFFAFKGLIKAINQSTNQQIFIYLAILLSMIQILINALASFPFQLSAPTMLFFSYFALATLIDQKVSKRNFYQIKAVYVPAGLIIPLIILTIFSTNLLWDWKKAEEYYYRSMISWKINNPQLMIDNGAKGFEYNSGRLKLLDFVSGGFILKNEPEKALPLLNVVLQKYPYRLNTLHYKAQSLYLLGRQDEGRETMKYLLSLKPKYAPGYDMLSMFDSDQGKTASAISNMKKAVELEPYNDSYRHKYALLLIEDGRYIEAKEQFEAALSISPDSALYNKNFGVLNINMLKQPEEGIPYLVKALKINPNISDAQSMRDTIQRYNKFLSEQLKRNQK